ncbi:FAD-dependent oxidoreductase [Mesorhizobium sp. B2-8-1]|uniref:FAD-dependent oxidoreductase n=1 Tax=unclassified Mesorhizobium TaxID=325217 RepID=UPI0011277D66|nr:FAD-binding protein [Mesorhizobium sp. B2-8-1]
MAFRPTVDRNGRQYDLIVIGSGSGGASLGHHLARNGLRVSLIERGGYLPRSRANWDCKTVFVVGACQTKETWRRRDGDASFFSRSQWSIPL